MRRFFSWLLVIVPYLMLGGLFLLREHDPEFIQSIRYKTFDFYQATWPRQGTNAPVYIIDIDEKSLAEIGQWPWPRTVMAELIEKTFSRLKAGTLALDVVFAEPDRTTPHIVSRDWPLSDTLRQQLATLPDHDTRLAEVIAKYPVVLGYVFQYQPPLVAHDDFGPKVGVSLRTRGSHNLQEGYQVIRNVPVIEQAAAGMGYFSFKPDSDGIVRKPSLVTLHNGEFYPILGMEALRLWNGARSYITDVNATGDVTAFRIGDIVLPTDARANFWVRYRDFDTSRYFSASDVLYDRLPEGALDGAIVFVGTSASGLLDIRATPVHPAMPGVDVHAQMVENVLDGQFLRRDHTADFYEQVFLLVMGLLLIVLVERFGALTGGFVVFSVLGMVTVMSVQAFRHLHMLVDVVYPSITIIGVYMVHNILKYAREESQRKAIRHAFGHYLSGDLINALTEAPDQLKLGGEQKHMTMLFSDIRGFTTLSESLPPQELTRLLNAYLTPMREIVMANKGTIDKYMGDAIMAFWNAPLTIQEHERLACASALAMLDKLRELNAAWAAEGRPTLDMGLGIHCGTVTVGNMGSTQRFDYTVLGDAVNLASRLEGLCKLYGVRAVVSHAIKDAVPDALCLSLDLVAVKGKTEPVAIYELVALGQGTPEQQHEVTTTQAAMDAYRARDWATAEKLFKTLKSHDTLRDLYLERIKAFRKKAPPKGWDGIYVATSK
jgi:adenylate cyclase